MNTWYQYSDEERSQMLDIAFRNSSQKQQGLSLAIIEKDWWVTMVLKALFASSVREFLSFKGGTSLSKGWHIIERFSEDIDLAIDHTYYDIESTNKSQREKLRKVGRRFIVEQLSSELEMLLHNMGMKDCKVVPVVDRMKNGEPIAIDSDKDPVVLQVQYRSVVPAMGTYMLPYVKVEISNLSMRYPTDICTMHSLLSESFCVEDSDAQVDARTVVPTRTFLEKIFLLAEEFQKAKPRTQRMSRHYYDLMQLVTSRFGEEALADKQLYQDIVAHREKYYHVHYVDYSLLQPECISFLPPENILNAYRADYETMKSVYVYGNVPTFDELMAAMKNLQDRIRKMGK